MNRADDFIGAGWAFPLGVSPTGGIALVRRETELEQAMKIILSTYPGERPMRPGFGCRLRDYVFRDTGHQTMAMLSEEVRTALVTWEPRVDIQGVRAAPAEDDPSLVHIDIVYAIKATNDRRNLVFPFYTIPEEEEDY
ncbi:GPW/gp25 family protein [Streptomyces sp. NBC_01264]|uniref:GPW/gp25 family protein n=1 Tax=Streptomyces sp. NBC_01264 TaxID=2903804 RepID=UPI00224DC62A|nr:GPW/gp25 family protein [Streptomyces sp. NBC_01264]MCX4781776.1 GPW/gp25 family protein [Streptomyces sp. NBC_01264]